LPDKVQIKACGYQKFDIINTDKKVSFFNNDKPVVLYNPHFKRELSSWYQFGQEILEFFYLNKQYNLIFAPHINLFNKRGFLSPKMINPKYFKADNIHIDLGSHHLVNMDYTLSADLYLGDVSSQIYEFILHPRPAIFINAHKINWTNNPHYKHWKMGEVIEDVDNLENLLSTRNKWQQKYLNKQKELFDNTFLRLNKGEASLNIKNAIKNNLNL
jgi:CDP-glycerol glycerophosphotransferase (TagB/SpsB family)